MTGIGASCDCGSTNLGHWNHPEWCAWRLEREERARRASSIAEARIRIRAENAARGILARYARCCGRLWIGAE